jgi:HAD superfamily hydrolase (TIGR01549 family)
MSEIQAAIFDCEGPIVDSEGLWDDGNKEFLAKFDIEYDRDLVKPKIGGKAIAEIMDIFKEMYPQVKGNTNELVDWHIKNMAAIFNDKVGYVSDFKRFYKEEVVKKGLKSAIATSMYPQLMKVVDKRLGLYKLFKGNVSTIDQVGYKGKPNPAIFLHAAKSVGVAPENCVVIEDAPNGIAGAKKAGMRCVGLAVTYDRSLLTEADIVVDSYSQLSFKRFEKF